MLITPPLIQETLPLMLCLCSISLMSPCVLLTVYLTVECFQQHDDSYHLDFYSLSQVSALLTSEPSYIVAVLQQEQIGQNVSSDTSLTATSDTGPGM